jgi:photosystem II stability/assembly factor-like uncharacterized protein
MKHVHAIIVALASVTGVAAEVGLARPLLAQDPVDRAGAADTRPEESQDANVIVDPALFAGLKYRMVGPTRGGRVTTVEGHRAHPYTFYMGTVGGGVWKTENYGQEWRPITDGHLETGSIGSVEVADSDPNVIYVGTGSDGIRSNVITGRGIYKSTDAGDTWTFLGLRQAGQIGAVKAHPENPDLVYVAALGHPFGPNEERGVFRSKDGGLSWEKVLFASDSVGAIDLELHPTNPSTIYAAMWRGERKPWTIISGARDEDGIWRSTDGGDTWERMTNGLPPDLIGKIDLGVSPADPDRVYALVEAPEPLEGLYRSDDRGVSWRLVNDRSMELMRRPFYYTNVTADPTDADVVWVNNERLWKSTDGGESFERVSTTHGDNHDLWINPDDSRIMIQSNDGGASVTLDGGSTWSTIHNQPTAELYQVDVDDDFPYWLYAGQQDNSTIAVPSLPPAESAPGGAEAWWKSIGGCETGPAVPRPGDPGVVYANCKGRFGLYNARTGQEQRYYVGAVNIYGHNPGDLPYRFQRTVPIEVSPFDPDVVYHGSQYVHRTVDGGRTWERISPDLTAFRPERQVVSGTPITRDITGEEHYSTLYVIEASSHDRREIWAGANDGPVHLTRDGGESWTDVTPPDMPPEGRMNAIAISPHQPGKVYIAGYRFQLDDWAPYIYRTTDYGETWTRLTDGTNGIPADYPVRVVREDPDREGLLYAGTEFGIFVSFDDGAHWQSLQLNLPATPITDIELVYGDLVLSTMGRSFWILDNVTPLHALSPERSAELAQADAHLFPPRSTYRMRYRTPGGSGARSPGSPEYPSPGATIDYYLGSAPDGDVALEILDTTRQLVRQFEGGAGEAPAIEPGGAGGGGGFGSGGAGGSRLRASAGMHRFNWDLRHAGPEGADRGPLVPPGVYTARLSVGDWSKEYGFDVRIDQRVWAEGVTQEDLEAQFELGMEVVQTLVEAEDLAASVEAMLEELEEAAEAGEPAEGMGALREELIGLRASLVDEDGSYPQPMLISQIEYLNDMISRADQPPGRDAYERLEQLQTELARAAEAFAELRGTQER